MIIIQQKKTALTIVENKIPDISNLATKSALTTSENKIPIVSSLVKKKQIITLKLLRSTLDGKITKSESIIKKYILFFGKYDV